MKKLLISGKMLVIANLLAINVHGMQKQTAEDEEVSQLSQSLAASASFSDESTDRVMPVSTSSVATMTDPFIPAPMVRVYFSPGLKEYFCELLNHEKSGIDMAFYRFTLLDVAKQIIERKRTTGIAVDLVVDTGFNTDFCDALKLFDENGIPVSKPSQRYYTSGGYETMHHKFAIFKKNLYDNEVLWTGSFNMTGAANENNWENVTLILEPETIRAFKEQFGLLKAYCVRIKNSDLIYNGLKPKSAFAKRINGIE